MVLAQAVALARFARLEAPARQIADNSAVEGGGLRLVGVEIDAELREHAVATARAVSARDRRLPALQRALDTIRLELYGERTGATSNGSNSDDGALAGDKFESAN